METKQSDEEESLRLVAVQTANAIRLARQRAEDELVRANTALESRTVALERVLRDLQTQVEITQILVNAKTIDEVANTILETLCRNFSWTCAQLWPVDRESGTLRRSAGWCTATMPQSDFATLARFNSLDRGIGLPGRILQLRQPLWITEIEVDGNFPRAPLARQIGLRSAFGFPLIVSGEVFAVIELFSTDLRPADEPMLKMAATLGSHIGQFIARGAAEEDQRTALRQLRRLQDVTATALANLTLQQLSENLLSKICEAIGCDTSLVLLPDVKTDGLRVAATFGLNNDSVRHLRLGIREETLASRVARERKLIVVRDAEKDPSIRPELRALHFQTLLGLPLLARNDLVAVLLVGSFSDREFTTDETDFIQLVGQQVAIAIENSSLYEEAREANRIRDRFLSIASHELKTPLTSILGWTQMLKIVDNEDIRNEAIQAIETSARNQAELIEDLLDTSRIREGKLVLRREPLDLAVVVAAAVKAVVPVANQRGVKLELDLPDLAVRMQGDPNRIRQVVSNLLTNAVKFTPAGKAVRTRVQTGEKMATITVEDEGEGISPEFLPVIFNELRQEEKGIRAGGLGLGLHIVKTIVNMHGGTVEAHSEGRDCGATFIVQLPLS